uniref:Uncharacterized protein n=1 Tax=Xiphophorus couchianus TaxID=32473 RepID=A0A3B5LZ05_9TELE
MSSQNDPESLAAHRTFVCWTQRLMVMKIVALCSPCEPFIRRIFFCFQARDRKVVGDQDGARRHAYTARALNITATVLIPIGPDLIKLSSFNLEGKRNLFHNINLINNFNPFVDSGWVWF